MKSGAILVTLALVALVPLPLATAGSLSEPYRFGGGFLVVPVGEALQEVTVTGRDDVFGATPMQGCLDFDGDAQCTGADHQWYPSCGTMTFRVANARFTHNIIVEVLGAYANDAPEVCLSSTGAVDVVYG